MKKEKKSWEFCVHEASHLVFERLINKLNIDFPPSTKIEISQTGGWQAGSIDGGWIQGNNTLEGQKQLKEFEKKSIHCKIAQIMHLLSGYASYEAIIDSSIDKHQLDAVYLPCPPCPSDIDKCQKIAGMVTKKTNIAKEKRTGRWKINQENIDFLQPIRNSVRKITQTLKVKEAIIYCAEILDKESVLEGVELSKVIKEIDVIIEKITIDHQISELSNNIIN